MRFKLYLNLWLPVLLWMVIIFWWSSIQHLAIATGWQDFWTRKPAHVVEYGLLWLLLYRAVSQQTSWPWQWRFGQKWAIAATLLALIYSISDELHQSLVPTRHGAATDVVIDCLGFALAAGLVWRQARRQAHEEAL